MIPKEFSRLVVDWFRREGRLLPWREGRDSYRIWISEIMLQQTRIEAVIPYYHRFLNQLPDVASLAACPEDKLLKLWEGLGYYSRARNLKKAAEKVMTDFGGVMPKTAAELRTLSGVGDYTAGAIASIAFGEPSSAVDGNVLRVLSRVLADESDIALSSTKKKMSLALDAIYPKGKEAGDLTEGIMEIGERVCIPNGAPLCPLCPLKDICLARKEGRTDSLPVKSPKKERKIIPMTVLVLCSDGKYALQKRPATGLLAGMWEFYHLDGSLSKSQVKKHLEEKGLTPFKILPLGKGKHIFTHLEWHMTGFLVEISQKAQGFHWKSMDEIEGDFALPGAFLYFKKKAKEKADG